MSSRKKQKGHLRESLNTMGKVLTEAVIILLILGSGWLIHSTAKALFREAPLCIDRTETIITIHGDSGVPRPSSKVDIRTIQERCKESR